MKRLFILIALLPILAMGQVQEVNLKARGYKYYANVTAQGELVTTSNDTLPVKVTNTPTVIPYKSIVIVSDTFARPNNTTAYTAKDVISTVAGSTGLHTLTGAVRSNGGSGCITKVKFFTDDVTFINAQIRIHFYDGSLTSSDTISDNLPYKIMWAKRVKRIASYDLVTSTEASGSDCAYAVNDTKSVQFKCSSETSNLQYVVEILGAVTPVANKKICVEVTIEQY